MENYIIEICLAAIIINTISCLVTIVYLSKLYKKSHGEFLDDMNDIEESAISSIREAYIKGFETCMKSLHDGQRGGDKWEQI